MSKNPYASPEQDSAVASPTRGEHQIVWTIWLTYGAFYFCRTNLSAALGGMEESVADGGLGLTPIQIGMILASLKLSYAVGQLINGQLSEHFSPRRLLALGMFGSAALNVMFGLGTGFYFLLFVWACNGYCQSLGWTPCVRVTANWVPVLRRGKAMGIIGTGYQVTLGLTFLIASQAAQHLGWRGALYVPAALLALGGIFMLVFLKESPDSNQQENKAGTGRSRGSFTETFLLTISNPALWLLGISLGLLNACRYGFLDWGLTHLSEVQSTGVGKAGLKYVVLAGGAVAGSYLAGWATDRFFGGRRAPMVCILLVLLSVLTLLYESVAQTSVTGTIGLLALIGFCIYGPQVLLVGTAPADLARRGTSAAAAGFVNSLGYIGAASGDVVTGWFKPEKINGMPADPQQWRTVIYLWAAWALAAAICAALLWNATARMDDKPSQAENS